MTRLTWDDPSGRQFITGIDRGVLYLADKTGVEWNGITSFEEILTDITTTPAYYDGIKFVQTKSVGDFAGVLKAFTYPSEFEVFDGMTNLLGRVWLTGQQTRNYFGLSYRTKMGDNVDQSASHYQIHLVYNLMADPANRVYTTMADKITPIEFAWNVTGVPVKYPGITPTCHLIFDSRVLHPSLMYILEGVLYGLDGTVGPGGSYPSTTLYPSMTLYPGGSSEAFPIDIPVGPRQPDISEIISIVTAWPGIIITNHGDGTWTATGDSDFIRMTDVNTFEISEAPIRYIDSDEYTISGP